MNKIRVTINNKQYEYQSGISLLEISNFFKDNFKFAILAAYVDNDLEELNTKITKDCNIKFIDLLDRTGNKIYQRTLYFALIYAVNLLYGVNNTIKICNSIDKGVLIKTSFNISENDIDNIKNKINELVSQNLVIEKTFAKRIDAIEYFNSLNDKVKADTLKYNTNTFVNLYKLGAIFNYFYSIMPPSISCLTNFDLTYISNNSFILQIPVIYLDGEIPEYINHSKMTAIFNEYDEYLKKINITSSADVNKLVSNGKISGIIKLDEVITNNKLLTIAEEIANKKDQLKLVLIAGPSSSGKTTTSRKLSMFLKSFGMNPIPLSIDDYFKNREETPKDKDGKYDFESLNAIRVDKFNEDLEKILNNETVEIPTFNFVTGQSEYKGNTIKLEKNDILIIEGLHAINEELTKMIPSENKYKLYVAELTSLNIDNQNVVSTSDVRLLRRIVRDARTRGYTAENTLETWNKVREGEEKYIFPFQNDVNAIYNTALIYEIGVLKLYATPLLYNVESTSPYYGEAKRLLNFLRMFLGIPSDGIPSDSIIREFIGNGFFE